MDGDPEPPRSRLSGVEVVLVLPVLVLDSFLSGDVLALTLAVAVAGVTDAVDALRRMVLSRRRRCMMILQPLVWLVWFGLHKRVNECAGDRGEAKEGPEVFVL